MINRGHMCFYGLYWLTVISLAVLIGLLAFRVWAAALPMEEALRAHVAAVTKESNEISA